MRLLARADDLGSFHSANRAILETCTAGIARNASILAVGHCFDEAVELVRDESGFAVGLHATITSEWENVRWAPVLEPQRIPALVDAQGHLVKRPSEADEQGATVEQILAEIEAQLAKARDAGVDVEYLDTHMRFEWVAEAGAALADLCRREGIVFASGGKTRLPRLSAAGAADPVQGIADAIATTQEPDAMIVAHPAYDDPEMRDVYLAGQEPGRIAREREIDRLMYTDPRVLEAVRECGATLVRYTDL